MEEVIMSQSPLYDEYKSLMGKLDLAIAALKETKLDHPDTSPLAGNLVKLRSSDLLMRLQVLKSIHGLNEVARHPPDTASLRNELGLLLRELRAFRGKSNLSFAIPRVWPAWQFWR
jgi:hypothetical protein